MLVKNMIETWIENAIKINDDRVFELIGEASIAYSDGHDVEQYLDHVFDTCKDLGSESAELETWIKNWPSEYHLSQKRSQLLKGFDYDQSSSVLEVGCGCGAISRYLAETFDNVVSVEGSRTRARLARKRCRDMDNIMFVSAPFQKIRFKRKFDIIFCVGVFEYSGAFVEGDDPYEIIMRHFSDYLAEDGVLILAIENQFGLKYFASASEDHTKTRYDGLEGYSRFPNKARTFGYHELQSRILRHFSSVKFYFPFPDYKIPDAVLSETMCEEYNVGELLGNFPSRDYLRPSRPNFSEKLTWIGIAKNQQVPFFAHSFLVVAGKKTIEHVTFRDFAVIYNTNRTKAYHTKMRISRSPDQEHLVVTKTPLNQTEQGAVQLTPYTENWHNGESLHHSVLIAAMSKIADINTIFAACRPWHEHLVTLAEEVNGDKVLSGHYVDAIWKNTFIEDGQVVFVDQQEQGQPITVKMLVMRAIFQFLVLLRESPSMSSKLRWKSTANIMKTVASQWGIKINRRDLREFITCEAKLHSLTWGGRVRFVRWHIFCTLALHQKTIVYLKSILTQLRAVQFYGHSAKYLLTRIFYRIVKS